MRQNAKEKEKQCAFCDRTFTKEEHLKRHERTHTGEKPFKCHKCERRYGRSDVLARHMQTHPLEDIIQVSRLHSAEDIATRRPSRSVDQNDGTDQRSVQTAADQSGRTNGLLTDNHMLPSSSDPQPIDLSSNRFPRVSAPEHQLRQPALLQSANEQQDATPASTSQLQPLDSDVSEGLAGVFPVISTSRRATARDRFSASVREDWHSPPPLTDHGVGATPQPIDPFLEGNTQDNTHASPGSYTNRSQPSLRRITRDQEVWRPEAREVGAVDVSTMCEPQPPHHDAGLRPAEKATLAVQPESNFDDNPFLFDADFSAYGYLSPGILDYLAFTTPPSPMANPSRSPGYAIDKPNLLFFPEQVRKLRQMWRGQQAAPGVRIIRTLWQSVVQHPADNIFSMPASHVDQMEVISTISSASRANIGKDCRERLMVFCRELDEKIESQDVADITGHSTPLHHNTRPESESLFPGLTVDGFPAAEVLDASLDFYFQCPHLPFLHKATFDPKTTPESLLLPIYLVGLSSLYPERSKTFVLHNQRKLMRFCRSDLTKKALGRCQPWELLVAIASALLVIYLGLAFLEDLDERQAHMLAVQMLHIAEKHGLFIASDGDDIASHLQDNPANSHDSWKAWSRAESIKRMICCLLWVDMGYTRLMGSAGVADIDKVELHLPCDGSLFEASTSHRFFQTAQRGAQLLAPRIQIHNFHINPPAALNHMAMETLLVGLYLQTAAIRHRSPIANFKTLEARESFTRSSKAKEVVKTVSLLPSRYGHLFCERHRVTALTWNNLCIVLTTDLDLLEVASGRDGVDSALNAIPVVAKWAQTPSARRAALHAAQIIDILSLHRLSEYNIARPDLLLFNSALVLSMYLFVSHDEEVDYDSRVFELLQDVDWTAVGVEGMRGTSQTLQSSSSIDPQRSDDQDYTAHEFIRYGVPAAFAGEVLSGNGIASRKILLNCVRLLDDLGKWRESKYSQLLRAMSDFIIARNL